MLSRHVVLPDDIAKLLPRDQQGQVKLLSEVSKDTA